MKGNTKEEVDRRLNICEFVYNRYEWENTASLRKKGLVIREARYVTITIFLYIFDDDFDGNNR